MTHSGRLLRVSLGQLAITIGLLAVVAVVLVLLSDPPGELPPPICDLWVWLESINAGTVAQIVPSIVVAVFVFAVGTAFVMVQIVPPARGARAATILQGRRMFWTIAPAPGLIIGSVIAVLDNNKKWAGAISVAILVGAILYLLESLWLMLGLLLDATDPSRFKDRLVKKAVKAIKCQAKHPPSRAGKPLVDPNHAKWMSSGARRQRVRQRATDDLYAIVRTARGWARVAAQTNDSRELLESLAAFLELIDCYATKVLAMRTVDTVPSIYWRDDVLNPSRSQSARRGAQDRGKVDAKYLAWAPPPLFDSEQPESERLSSTWLANEIGRAVVRAIELGIRASNFLDRDMRRLLNTLVIGASRFHDAALQLQSSAAGARADGDVTESLDVLTWNAGVMIRYLVQVGLGVRHSSADKVDWYSEPGIQLAILHRGFVDDARRAEKFAEGLKKFKEKMDQMEPKVSACNRQFAEEAEKFKEEAKKIEEEAQKLKEEAKNLAEADSLGEEAKKFKEKAKKFNIEANNFKEKAEKFKESTEKEEAKRLAEDAKKFAEIAYSCKSKKERSEDLATGAAAGVLLVAASLITARSRHGDGPGGDRAKQEGAAPHEVPCAIVKAAGPLDLTMKQAESADKLAFGPVFEPGQRLIVDQPEDSWRGPLLAELSTDQCRSRSLHQQRDVVRHPMKRCHCQDGIVAWL